MRKQASAADRKRRRIFAHIRDLGWDDTARRTVAASFRKDGRETMQGMKLAELSAMEQHLFREVLKAKNAARRKADTVRSERLRQHRRVDGPKGKWASERARWFVAGLAKALWGEEWEVRLNQFIIRQCEGYWIPWNSQKFPRGLHYKVVEGLKQMAVREGKVTPLNPPVNGEKSDSGRVWKPCSADEIRTPLSPPVNGGRSEEDSGRVAKTDPARRRPA